MTIAIKLLKILQISDEDRLIEDEVAVDAGQKPGRKVRMKVGPGQRPTLKLGRINLGQRKIL